MNWTSVLLAVGILAAIGLICALILAIASKYMAVPVDEKFPVIRGCLPGANCGACGYAGCDGYANALVDGTEDKINKCVPGGNQAAQALAEACGKEFEEAASLKAFVHCKGDCKVTEKKAAYTGSYSCASAKLVYSGSDGACVYGCLGYGDCAAVCTHQAINIINGVAHVNSDRCGGCGICRDTCPQHIISIMPADRIARVVCSNQERGVNTLKHCKAGCIGCGLCVRNCPAGAITLVNNRAVIDYDKCENCGKCAEVCRAQCIS